MPFRNPIISYSLICILSIYCTSYFSIIILFVLTIYGLALSLQFLISAFLITSYTTLAHINSSYIKKGSFSVAHVIFPTCDPFTCGKCPLDQSMLVENRFCPVNRHCAHWACLYFVCCTLICLHIVPLFLRSSAKWLNVNLNVNVEQLQGESHCCLLQVYYQRSREQTSPCQV